MGLHDISGSMWRDHSDDGTHSPSCVAQSIEPADSIHSFQLHQGDNGLSDAIANLLSDGCCSSDRSSEDDSPTPDYLPAVDWGDVLSQVRTLPLAFSPDEERDRRRYRRSPKPAMDMRQQRAIIDAEKASRKEEYHRKMAEQSQPTAEHTAIAVKILCNEAHRRHYSQAVARKATENEGAPSVVSDGLECIAAAWRNVAECVQDSLFLPVAVQGRLSCMGIFRNNMKVSDLIAFDDHEEERVAIRMRQQQIINKLWQQAMNGGNPLFLNHAEDEAHSPTAFIDIGDYF